MFLYYQEHKKLVVILWVQLTTFSILFIKKNEKQKIPQHQNGVFNLCQHSEILYSGNANK